MTKEYAKEEVNIVPPGHRYINDYYGYRVVTGKPENFIPLGQWNEYDLYAVKCRDEWSVGARWSDEGSDYMGAKYKDTMEKIEKYGSDPERCPATDFSALRFSNYLKG